MHERRRNTGKNEDVYIYQNHASFNNALVCSFFFFLHLEWTEPYSGLSFRFHTAETFWRATLPSYIVNIKEC